MRERECERENEGRIREKEVDQFIEFLDYCVQGIIRSRK